jgi:hypothetical protein
MKDIIEKVNEIEMRLREDDELWLNATKLAKQAGKQLINYWSSPDTVEYMEELVKELGIGKSLKSNDLKKTLSFTRRGNNGGTYLHPELAIHFTRWLSVKFSRACDKAIKQITKNGYYISDNMDNNQETAFVKEIVRKYDRRIIDLNRQDMIEFIHGYLGSQGYSEKQCSALLSSVYNHCHVATCAKVASQIVLDAVEDGSNIVTHNTLRKMTQIFKSDYTSAINYYDEEMLEVFGEYYENILRAAKFTIRNKRIEPTGQSVVKAIRDEANRVVRLYSGLSVGDEVVGVKRDKLNEMVGILYDKGFLVSEEDKIRMITEMEDGRTFIVK